MFQVVDKTSKIHLCFCFHIDAELRSFWTQSGSMFTKTKWCLIGMGTRWGAFMPKWSSLGIKESIAAPLRLERLNGTYHVECGSVSYSILEDKVGKSAHGVRVMLYGVMSHSSPGTTNARLPAGQ